MQMSHEWHLQMMHAINNINTVALKSVTWFCHKIGDFSTISVKTEYENPVIK